MALWRVVVPLHWLMGHMVSLWKHIRSGWANFSRFIKFEVGDVTRIKF